MIIILCHLTQTLNIFELFIFWFNYSFFFTVFNLICFFFLSWHFTPVFFFSVTENYSGMIIPFIDFWGNFFFFLTLWDLVIWDFFYIWIFLERKTLRESYFNMEPVLEVQYRFITLRGLKPNIYLWNVCPAIIPYS